MKKFWQHFCKICNKAQTVIVLIPAILVILYTHQTYEYIITRTAPIELLASAIATEEGYFAGQNSISYKDNNPGDLTASSIQRPKDYKGFVIFKSRQEGTAALYNQLLVYAVKGYTIREMVAKYAPPDSNDTTRYVRDIVAWTGMDPDRKMMDYLTIVNMTTEHPPVEPIPQTER